jgi:hypothetical protein
MTLTDPSEVPPTVEPEPVIGLGEGEPPEGMPDAEAAPENGASDEAEGEVLDPDEAESESERAAQQEESA